MKPVKNKKKTLSKVHNSSFEMHQRLREVEVILLIKKNKKQICIYSYCPSRQDLDLFCYPFFISLTIFFYSTQNSPQVRRV